MTEILALRHESARLLGFGNYAEYSLATKMASSVGEVRGLGLFWAIELVRDRETREPLVVDWRAPVAEPFYRAAWQLAGERRARGEPAARPTGVVCADD